MQQPLAVTLTKQKIAALRLRALRKRVWFRALDRVERGLVDLTIQWVDRVQNSTMVKVLIRILSKLVKAMKNRITMVLEKGINQARSVSRLAVAWGNSAARLWSFERNFVEALGRGVLSIS